MLAFDICIQEPFTQMKRNAWFHRFLKSTNMARCPQHSLNTATLSRFRHCTSTHCMCMHCITTIHHNLIKSGLKLYRRGGLYKLACTKKLTCWFFYFSFTEINPVLWKRRGYTSAGLIFLMFCDVAFAVTCRLAETFCIVWYIKPFSWNEQTWPKECRWSECVLI